MEGMREVALAHYEILTDEEKTKIQRDFKQMVTDGNVSEYFNSISNELTPEIIDEVIETCKEKKEGNMDFKAFITSKYILQNQILLTCDGCSSLIFGRSFFSCYECFCNIEEDSYDLCCGCYSSKKFKDHHHQEFFDNHAFYKQRQTMFAKTKSGRDKRETLEQVYISLASAFLDLAAEVKTQKSDTGDFESFPKAIYENSCWADQSLKKLQAVEKELDKKSVENLTRLPTPRGSVVDLLGVGPSILFGQNNAIQKMSEADEKEDDKKFEKNNEDVDPPLEEAPSISWEWDSHPNDFAMAMNFKKCHMLLKKRMIRNLRKIVKM